MNDQQEEHNRSANIRTILQIGLVYLSQIFLYAVGITVLVGVSFLFTGGFAVQAYSDRLFIAGVVITLVGVFVFITIGGTRRNMGLPTFAKTKEDARKIIDHSEEIRDKAEKRYDAGSKVWAVGAACMLLSILFYYLLSII
jgi:sugar phosphate permease